VLRPSVNAETTVVTDTALIAARIDSYLSLTEGHMGIAGLHL